MEEVTSVAICRGDETTKWRTLLTISGTINGIIGIYITLNFVIKLIFRWRHNRLPLTRTPHPVERTDDFICKHRGYLAALMADALLTLTSFAGALYLLITGAVSTPFAIQSDDSCHMVTTATFLSAVAIGRLCVAIVMMTRYKLVLESPAVAVQCDKQQMEQVLQLVAFSLLLNTSGATLTKALLLIMSVDQNLYSLGSLLTKYPEAGSPDFRVKLKVTQCFLSIAFRGAVPLVTMLVATVMYGDTFLKMDTKSVAVVIGCAIVYVFYNTWVIIRATRDVWHACSNNHNKPEKTPGTFLTNNKQSMFQPKLPLDFDFTRNDTKPSYFVNQVHSRTDFDQYLDQHIPRPYSGMHKFQQKPPTSCAMCASKSTKVTPNKLNNAPPSIRLANASSPVPLKPCSNVNCYTQPKQEKKNMGNKKLYIKADLTPDLPTIDEESESMENIPL